MMYELEWYRVSIALRLYRGDVGHFLIYPENKTDCDIYPKKQTYSI